MRIYEFYELKCGQDIISGSPYRYLEQALSEAFRYVMERRLGVMIFGGQEVDVRMKPDTQSEVEEFITNPEALFWIDCGWDPETGLGPYLVSIFPAATRSGWCVPQ